MGDKTVSVRVKFEGGQAVKAGLQEVGREGTKAMQSIGQMSGQARAQIQNAGYQISDFFVQVSGGTSPMRAFSQQFPQLVGGLGLVGVAASVLVAALPSLWSMFGMGSDEAKDLKKELDEVAKAVDAASGAADLAREPIEALRKKYGDLAESIRDARIQAAELARAEAARAVNGLLSGTTSGETGNNNSEIAQALAVEQAYKRIADLKAILTPEQAQFFDFTSDLAALGDVSTRIKEVRAGIQGMADDFGISFDQAAAVAAAMDRVRDSAGGAAAEQVAAAQTLVGLLEEVYGSAAAADEATGGLVTKLNESVLAAGDLAAIDLAGPIWSGVEAATALANELARAASLEYGKVANAGGMDAIARGQMAKNTPNIFGSNPNYDQGIKAGRKGGGGGGGGGGSDPDIARAKALTEGLRTETEKYAASLEEVNRLKEKGLITDETYIRQLDKLKEGLGEIGDVGREQATALKSAFANVFDDPKQALEDLAKQLAMIGIFKQFLPGVAPGLFGAGGMFEGVIPGFAAGGRHRGGLRIVGENGPELEATGPSMIYPNDMLSRMGGGGGGGTQVNIMNSSGGEVQTQERRGPNGQQIIDVAIGKSIGGGRQDGAMRARFGSRPAAVKR